MKSQESNGKTKASTQSLNNVEVGAIVFKAQSKHRPHLHAYTCFKYKQPWTFNGNTLLNTYMIRTRIDEIIFSREDTSSRQIIPTHTS